MNAESVARLVRAVIAVDNDCRFVAEPADPRADCEQANSSRRIEAEVLVQVVVVESGDRRLEDVCGRGRA